MNYVFLITGWNCEAYVKQCLDSVLAQRVPAGCNLWVYAVDDGSTDATRAILQDYKERHRGQFTFLWTSGNQGAASSRYMALTRMTRDVTGNDVVVLVDMDDYLPHDGVLKRVHDEYRQGACVTYGHFTTDALHGMNLFGDFLGPYPPGVVRRRSYRQARWHCWPLRTFRYRLVEGLPARLFQDWQGRWLYKSTDLALMYPILERCPPARLHYIDEVLYVYRSSHAHVSRRRCKKLFGDDYKERVHAHLRKMKPQEVLTEAEVA